MFDDDIFGGDRRDPPDSLVGWASFEDAVTRELSSEFSGGNFRRQQIRQRDTFSVNGAKFVPDQVVYHDGCVLCVADAKDRARLTRADAEDVARYSALKPEEVPRIYVPERCHVQQEALAVEAEGRIKIIRLPFAAGGEETR